MEENLRRRRTLFNYITDDDDVQIYYIKSKQCEHDETSDMRHELGIQYL